MAYFYITEIVALVYVALIFMFPAIEQSLNTFVTIWYAIDTKRVCGCGERGGGGWYEVIVHIHGTLSKFDE